ncbi:hypothetical protein GCM10009605_11410 [Nocardiopsis composta]
MPPGPRARTRRHGATGAISQELPPGGGRGAERNPAGRRRGPVAEAAAQKAAQPSFSQAASQKWNS